MAERIIERDSLELYLEDQSKYSIIVNRRRMVPAIQDGLIPVQRRVLYAAYENGFTSESKHKKSAKLIGDIMGRFHPHGDCLGGDTVVYLLNGTIRSLYELTVTNQPVEIISVDPNTQKIVPAVAHSFRIGQYTNKKFHIVFSNGYEIRCTSNHPFMLPDGKFIKAEDINPYTRLLVKDLHLGSKSGRPHIDGDLLQNIVANLYYGDLPAGYDRHHKDYNPMNNTLNNLVILPHDKHVLCHQNDYWYSNIYNDGLEKGRHEMFSEDGKFREKTFQKNSLLMQLYNKNQGFRRFKYAIGILKDRNMRITEDNYESLRGEIYNLPRVSTLMHKYNCNNFIDLVNFEIESVGEEYSKIISKESDDNLEAVEKSAPTSNSYKLLPTVKKVIDKIIDLDLPYNIDSYKQLMTQGTSMSDESIILSLNLYKNQYPFITNIWIEDVCNEPMFDFTVDGLENMMIPLGSTSCTEIGHIAGNILPLISVHNSSIYGAIVTLASWYKCKYPLMYGYGNWGNVSGAGPASQRYTECALSTFGYDMMIDELAQSPNIVEWMDNFDRTDKEPEYLPTKIPNILVNGAFGIGFGMKIEVPPHNIGDVINETIALIENPNHKVKLIPDVIQSCDLICDDWQSICNTGRGNFKVRGKIITEQDKKGNYSLHIISLPDKVSCDQVYDKILEMTTNKQLPMVKEIANNIKDLKPDIIIDLKQGADPEYVKQAIFAKTDVQKSFTVNFEAVAPDGINIKRYSYKSYLQEFINIRLNTKFRLYCGKLQQVMTRHIQVDAFIKVLSSKELDKIINMIRKYNGTDTDHIVEFMIKNCKVSDIQAKFILSRTLPQLSKGNLKKYIEEEKELQNKIKEYQPKVTDDGSLIKQELIEELKSIKKKYNTPRVCNVLKNVNESDIPAGTFKLVITERNFIRKIPDVDKVNIVRKDNPKFILRVDNRENILLFDNKGRVFNLPIHKIPITDRQGPGTDVRILVKNLTADIASIVYEPILKEVVKSRCKHYLAVLTRSNTIKKIALDDFLNVSPSGLIYSKIKDTDEVVGVQIVAHNLDIAICSDKKVLRCKLKDIPEYKRNATGAKAMNTKEPIHSMSVMYPECQFIIVVTKNGKFNKFPVGLLESNSRGKAGHKVIKLDSNDEIMNVYGANDTDSIKVVTTEGTEIVPVANIKVKSSIAAGEKLIKNKGLVIRSEVVINK